MCRVAQSSAVLLTALLALPALSQSADPATGGALLDAGGKKLTKDEMLQLTPGSTTTGVVASFPHRRGTVTHYPDKTSKGTTSDVSGGGNVRGTSGVWDIDENGNICSDVTIRQSRANPKNCTMWYRLGEKYFVAKLSIDRNEPVYVREVER